MKKIICVLGMHRSGTSVITRGVVALGAYPGDHLIPPSEDNLKGFWEDLRIFKLNESILKSVGFNWFDYDHSVVDRFSKLLPTYQNLFMDEALSILNDLFNHSDCVVIKDPRFCILLPFWKTVFKKFRVDVRYICVFRNPLEVSKSMNIRDGIDIQNGLRLWQYYNLRLLCDVHDKLLFLNFDSFLKEVNVGISKIRDYCDLSENVENVEEFINEFISLNLKHHNSSKNELENKKNSNFQIVVFDKYLQWSKKAYVSFADINDFIESSRSDLFDALDRSLMTAKRNITFQVFIKIDGVFLEKSSLSWKVDVGYCDISLDICASSGAELRIDPGDMPCILKLDSLTAHSEEGTVSVKIIGDNSVFSNDAYYVYDTNDPQLQVLTDGAKVSSVRFCGYILPLGSRLASIPMCFINKKLSDTERKFRLIQTDQKSEIENKRKEIIELNQELVKARSEVDNLEQSIAEQNIKNAELDQIVTEQNIKNAELDQIVTEQNIKIKEFKQERIEQKEQTSTTVSQLTQRINELENTIKAMLSSSSWVITKPYRFFGRIFRVCWLLIRKLLINLHNRLKSNKVLRLPYNFFVSLKNDGIRPTVQKVKSKITSYIIMKQLFKKEKVIEKDLSDQCNINFDYNVKTSIITALYNTPENFLRAMMESVLNQTYSNWELCLVDASDKKHSCVQKIINSYARTDNRILYKKIKDNEGISDNTNIAVQMSSGEYLAFLDHDDTLTPDCIFEIVSLLNQNKDLDVIYSDQDKINEFGKVYEPFFKPDWSPDHFRGVMYVGHLLVVRKTIGEQVNWFNSSFDRIQDYEFLLRVSEITDKIGHIPKILYHWRAHSESIAQKSDAKGSISELQKVAVAKHLKRLGIAGMPDALSLPHRLQIFPLHNKDNPLVSIIIPTKNKADYLKRCIDSIIKTSVNTNYEILIMDNDSDEMDTLNLFKNYSKKYKQIKVVRFKGKFNFSKINNFGVSHANGDYIILLNNDTEIITDDWIKNLLFYAMQDDIGVVGALLVFPDDTVQHAGCVLGFRGTADHVMRGWPATNCDGYFGSLCCAREVSAVTGACLMISKKLYKKIDGLNVHFNSVYQDVDLCLKIRKLGFRIIYTPTVKIIHYESLSRGNDYDFIDRQLLIDCWRTTLTKDPYYNKNLSLLYGLGKVGYEVQ
jgi:GT2 family glycosyltransferase